MIADNAQNVNSTLTRSALGQHRQMLAAALYYAGRGWAVFPLHTPIFDAGGKCVGCTCEIYRTSAECKAHHPHLYLGPDGKCENPGKCPRVRWREKSTTDEKQIRQWWGQQWAWGGHTPNIGIDCSKSGILVFDADTYKAGAGDLSDLLTLAEQETVTVRTGGGGQHLIFDAGGKEYGNNVGELPNGIDVRGAGGYIVAAPSLHKSGRAYAYEEGYGPRDIALAPIPAALNLILTEAHQKAVASAPAIFTATTTDKPILKRWRLSQRITETINQAAPVGQRSEADMSVCVALAYAGATDDEILSVFEHYPVGTEGKYAERGRLYLAHTIGRARAHVTAHPRPDQLIERAKEYLLTCDIGRHVPDELKTAQRDKDGEIVGYRYSRRNYDMPIGSRVLDIMASVGRVDAVTINAYQIVRTTNSQGQPVQIASHKTVKAALTRLTWFFDAQPTDRPNTWAIRLADSFKVVLSKIPVTCTIGRIYTNIDDTGKTLTSTFDQWKADDPYGRGVSRVIRDRLRDEIAEEVGAEQAAAPSPTAEELAERYQQLVAKREEEGLVTDREAIARLWYAAKGQILAERLTAAAPTDEEISERYSARLGALAPGLGSSAILVIHTLTDAGGSGATVDELGQAHGLTPSSVGAILRKLRGLGLVESHRRYMEASLHFIVPAAFAWIAEHQKQFRTYQAGVKRLDRALESAQRRAEKVAAATETPAEHRNAANRRAGKAANKRFATLRTLHPDWNDRELAEQIYGAVVLPTVERSHAPLMAEPSEIAWGRLTELTGRVFLTDSELRELRTLDRALGAGVRIDWDAQGMRWNDGAGEIAATALLAQPAQPQQVVMSYV